jgi:hypothetical protein
LLFLFDVISIIVLVAWIDDVETAVVVAVWGVGWSFVFYGAFILPLPPDFTCTDCPSWV